MHDEQHRLRQVRELAQLLSHYARAGGDDRDTWRDRIMELDKVSNRDLIKLHGELIAYGWIEQNTGVTPNPREKAVSSCYRITRDGLRAFQAMQEPAAA